MRDYVLFYLNGKRQVIRGRQVFLSLANYLRHQQRLTGTKVVCAEGDCGSCTVLRAKVFVNQDGIEGFTAYEAINACITFLYLLDGTSLVTVEGLKHQGELSSVQKALAENHGSQCGFCTPGFVMSLTALFDQQQSITEKKVKNYCTGNLCRCTGYQAIIEAALSIKPQQVVKTMDRYDHLKISQDLAEVRRIPVKIEDSDWQFLGPVLLSEAAKVKSTHPEAKIFAGATDLGVQINKGMNQAKKVIVLSHIQDLGAVEMESSHLTVGANVTLQELENSLENVLPEFSRYLRVFASPQIKHSATLVGNIANASPIGDTLPPLLALDAELVLFSHERGERRLKLKDFFKGYKQCDLAADEILTHVIIPLPSAQNVVFKCYKVAKRKDLDISAVSGAFHLTKTEDKIRSARIAYGGVGPFPLRLPEVEKMLINQRWERQTFQAATNLVERQIQPLSDHRGSTQYRHLLAKNLLMKCFDESQQRDVS